VDAEEGGHVRVGDVVDELADGPASFAVRRVEFGIAEAAEGLAELFGHLSKGEDGVAQIFGRNGGGRSEWTDGIASVGW
jgi:hypothetical protein